MVTTLLQKSVAREAGYEGIQYVCGRMTLSGTADGANLKIGTIPAGAVIVGIASKVVTVLAGGTPVFGIGTTSATVGTNATISALTIAAGSQWIPPSIAAFVMPLATDVDVWVGTTGGTTSGDAVVCVFFVKPLA